MASTVIRDSETIKVTISQNVKNSDLIGFDHKAAGMLYIPSGFPHTELQFHASDAKVDEFYPIPGAVLEVEPETAVPIPAECIGARHLKVTGNKKSTDKKTTDVEISVTRKS